MTIEAKELYTSANGDRRYLVRDPTLGRVFVRHEPDTASGGRASDTGAGDFLVRGGHRPEHRELLRLTGTLVEGGPGASESV